MGMDIGGREGRKEEGRGGLWEVTGCRILFPPEESVHRAERCSQTQVYWSCSRVLPLSGIAEGTAPTKGQTDRPPNGHMEGIDS